MSMCSPTSPRGFPITRSWRRTPAIPARKNFSGNLISSRGRRRGALPSTEKCRGKDFADDSARRLRFTFLAVTTSKSATGGGNIEVQDIDGRIRLTSAGGNINVGRVGGGDDSGGSDRDAARDKSDRLKPVLLVAARIDTQGGHITVGDVAGTLRATTSGGHITTGNIAGDAVLRTGGGQIYAGHIAGTAALDSGGGNIHIEGAGSSVTADTAGGGIVLRQADAPLRVSANPGGITAWLR